MDRLAQLEEETKRRLERLHEAVPDVKKAPTDAEMQELSQSSQAAMARQQELKDTIEKRKRARELAVPTNDNAVKLKLREFGEPICLFGETAPDRRERLREVMAANLDLEQPGETLRGADTLLQRVGKRAIAAAYADARQAEEEPKHKELFYTEGSEALRETRRWVCELSLGRAAARVAAERARIEAQCADQAAYEASQRQLGARLKGVQNQLSNFADERPIAYVGFSPGSSMVATGSWSALIKLWSVPDCACVATLRGHTERISGLAWHPQARLSQSASSVNLVSASCDSTAKLWSIEGGKPLGELVGHVGRLSRVAFHPSGRLVGTTSFDTSWRLWDVERCTELLLQEGHSRPLYAIAFHPDGSLVATAGLDAIIRLWDLRTGRSIQVLPGHVKQILGLDFSPVGTTLASGSDDHTVRLWDLRKKKCLYTIPAHSSLISHVRFEPNHGEFVLSSSYDNKVKLWSMRDFSLLKTMEGHEGRVMCADISDDGKYFATAAMDRTWKLWG
ncbi:hypothetical protein AB1Y20_019337 [Prymnesium parvum]|uniref:Pre-mRNA processing factor 4 (PRP4)-like domain-containing protein n=1 Tax=Prymnesium parvum TaxID=97485 RepID=A0AB34JU43_PRYPA